MFVLNIRAQCLRCLGIIFFFVSFFVLFCWLNRIPLLVVVPSNTACSMHHASSHRMFSAAQFDPIKNSTSDCTMLTHTHTHTGTSEPATILSIHLLLLSGRGIQFLSYFCGHTACNIEMAKLRFALVLVDVHVALFSFATAKCSIRTSTNHPMCTVNFDAETENFRASTNKKWWRGRTIRKRTKLQRYGHGTCSERESIEIDSVCICRTSGLRSFEIANVMLVPRMERKNRKFARVHGHCAGRCLRRRRQTQYRTLRLFIFSQCNKLQDLWEYFFCISVVRGRFAQIDFMANNLCMAWMYECVCVSLNWCRRFGPKLFSLSIHSFLAEICFFFLLPKIESKSGHRRSTDPIGSECARVANCTHTFRQHPAPILSAIPIFFSIFLQILHHSFCVLLPYWQD